MFQLSANSVECFLYAIKVIRQVTVQITTDRAAEEATLTIARSIATDHLHRRADLCGIFMDALTSVPPTIFHHDNPGQGVFTRKSGHITIDWKRVFERASMVSLNLVSDDSLALADAALTLCARHLSGAQITVGADEATVLCAIWSYRNVDGRIDVLSAHQVASENFILRGMGELEHERFEGILFVLCHMRILGFTESMITMPDRADLSYS
jgi:hypothetical protein